MIVLKEVTKRYGKVDVLSHVSLAINPGEFVCLTGPSGAGKSTLLSLLIGAEDATIGTVSIDGVDLRKVPPKAMQHYRRRIGIVFQDGKLLKNRTVAENIAFPLEVCGASDAFIVRRVSELLKQIGLSDHTNLLPRELSGGEQTRVAIARAIAHTPLILLADEPTGNLDPVQSLEIMLLLQRINAEGTTVILATHDTAFVDVLQTRVIRLEKGKVLRDSQGGYDRAKRREKKAASEEKHEVFDTSSEHETSEDDEGKKGDGRKIKITSIGS